MNKKIKLLSFVSVFAIGALFGFTACGGDDVGEHDHVYDDGVITTEATCYKEGVKTFTCTVEGCGQTKTAPISMIAHSWNGGEITKQAKCNEEGVKTFTCTVEGCGKTKEEPIGKSEHGWNDGVITKTPDFLTGGTKTFTCLDCEEEKTESVAARADFSEQYYATLTESNNWLYGYANTYDTQTGVVDYVPITETENNVWKSETTQIGKGYVCTEDIAVIAYAFNRELPKSTQTDISVSFVGEESTTRLKAYIIINDYCVELNSDNAKDWSYQSEEALDIAKDDTVYLVLENNGEGKAGGSLAFRLTAPCIHVWDEGTVTKKATCLADGLTEYGCISCDKTYTEAITERPDHTYTGDWLVGENGHYKKCDVCDSASEEEQHKHDTEDTSKRIDAKCSADGVKYLVCECGDEVTEAITERPAHNWQQTGHKDATNDEDGYTDYECGNDGCNATKRDTIPSLTHKKGTEYRTDDNNHWFVCSEHTDCGVKFEEASHTFIENRTNATLYTAGKIEFICSCGKHDTDKEAVLPARADFRDDFTLENQDGAWSYGKMNDPWNENRSFVASTEKTSDAWIADGVEIKAGWISASGEPTIAYTAQKAIDVNVKVVFEGGADNTLLGIRIYSVNEEGKIAAEKGFNNLKNDDGKQVIEIAYAFKENETLYFMFSNEHWDSAIWQDAHPNGKLDITITASEDCVHSWNEGKVTTEATCNSDGVKTYACVKCGETKTEAITERPDHTYTGDWLVGANGHYKKCDVCDSASEEEQHKHDTENTEKRIDASCNADGVKYLVCECGDEVTEAITERPEHTYTGDWLIGENGHYKKCDVCDSASEEEQHKHDTEDTEKRIDAKCNADGVKYLVCECGDEVTEAITERPAHNWQQTGHKDATNDEDGYTDYECGNDGCDATKHDTIPALNHKKGTEYGTDDGKHWFICTEHDDCGYKFEEAVHNYTERLESQDKAATCGEDGYTVWKCVCGKTETRTVSKDTVSHNYDGQPFVSDDETTHHQNCKVCGNASDSVAHGFNEGETTTAATFWKEGVITKTCSCGETATSSIAKINEINHADEFTVENQDGNWEYGKIDMNDWDHMVDNPKTQSTVANEGNDGWVTGDYSSIKSDWMSASNAIYIAFKAKKEVTIEVEIVVTRIEGMKRLDVRTDSDDDNNAKYHGGYGEDGVMKITETYTLSEGSKLYMVFTAKSEDSGFEQANYSIKIKRV